jgi:hypothetical protein
MQLMLEVTAGRTLTPRSVPVSWIVQNLGGGLPEDRAECPTTSSNKTCPKLKTLELQRGTRKDLWPKYFPECPVARHFVCPKEKQFNCQS